MTTPATSTSGDTSNAPSSLLQTSKKRSMAVDDQESTTKKRQRTAYDMKPDQEPITTVNFAPIIAGLAGISLQEQRLDKGKSRVEESSASTLADAMASVYIQEHASRSSKQTVAQHKQQEQRYPPVKQEESSSTNSTTPPTTDMPSELANEKFPSLRWYQAVFEKEKGDSFAYLFDILWRYNYNTEILLYHQILALPASSTERRARLAAALLELKLKQSWLQKNKQAYLSHPENRDIVRWEALIKLYSEVQAQERTRMQANMELVTRRMVPDQRERYRLLFQRVECGGVDSSTPLEKFQGKAMKQEFEQKMAQEVAQEDACWKVKAEAERKAAEQKQMNDHVRWRVKVAEDSLKFRLKSAEDRFKRQLKEAEDRFKRQLKETEDRFKRQLKETEERARRVQEAEDPARRASPVESRSRAEPRSDRLLARFAKFEQAQGDAAQREPRSAEMGGQATGSLDMTDMIQTYP
ncbi:hypothetical protein BG000_009704 [Podila horticola]|nr:hypothetical protein BG000_009704 [Podila horticola]